MSAADRAYDRLHGLDGHTQAATIRRVARPRGALSKEQLSDIAWARKAMDQETARYRRAVLRALAEGASFSEVSKATGLSTNTLQRWKREAAD